MLRKYQNRLDGDAFWLWAHPGSSLPSFPRKRESMRRTPVPGRKIRPRKNRLLIGFDRACRYNGTTAAEESGVDRRGRAEGRACTGTAARAAREVEGDDGGGALDFGQG